MNIKEIKANTEKAVNIVLRSMVGPEVKVENSYNLETNTMNVGLVNDLGDGFVSATGLIERGRIHLNDKVSVASGRGIFSSFVTELVVDEKKVEEAKAGEVLTIKIDKMTATDVGAGDSIYVNTSLF